jgi:short-chain fatty acids transporter
MHPVDSEIIHLPREKFISDEVEKSATNKIHTVGDKLDNSRIFTTLIGGLLLIFLVKWFYEKGLNLNLNIVNWTFLAAGLLLSRNVIHFVKLIKNASTTVGEILLQYPFYAGIMGLMAGSGLVDLLSNWFVTIASADTLSFFAFLSAGIINVFIPSGGGQWAIQGPVFIQAAQELNVDPSVIVMGIAYGDQWTNMIQPFFTIPLLAIAGLDMRKIMGFTFIILLVTLVCFGGGLLIMGAGY